MMDQLYRWAVIEAGESGLRNFGMPMTLEKIYRNDVMWGFKVSILKEGVKLTDLAVKFDDDSVKKHEWVGRGADGFPVMEGKNSDIEGKNFQIWKIDDAKVDEDLRSTIRAFCTGLVSAVNKYYAFGSVFSEDL